MTDMPVVRVALAGDTMLGRAVADRIAFSRRPPFAAEVVAAAAEADLFIVNLECCISARGARRPAPGKAFLVRAPPLAAELLAQIGVDCVTLANKYALDYGSQALLDTLARLQAAGIACVGAGPDETAARAPHAPRRANRAAMDRPPLHRSLRRARHPNQPTRRAPRRELLTVIIHPARAHPEYPGQLARR